MFSSGRVWSRNPVKRVFTFPMTENPVSQNGAWVNTGSDHTVVQTSAGVAFGTQDGSGGFDDSYAHLTGFANNHKASAVIHLGTGITSTFLEVEIFLRMAEYLNGATLLTRGYECNLAHDGAYAQVVRWDGPVSNFTQIANVNSVGPPANGDTFSAQIIGNHIKTFLNGTLLCDVIDSTYGDGNPGMSFYISGPTADRPKYGFSSYTASDNP